MASWFLRGDAIGGRRAPALGRFDRWFGSASHPLRSSATCRGRPGSVLGDGEDRRVDPKIACEAEPHRRVASPRPSQHRRAVVLQVAGAEQHDRDDDDIGGPAGDEGVESGVDRGFSQLEDPDANGGGWHQGPDEGHQPVELGAGPGITTAVPEDEQSSAF